ncbi:MAG: endonuclease domain-containing protein, partial [Bacteroidota bacterium]
IKPKGFKFRRQHPIAGYVLDFYCHKLRLSIEIDGGYHLKKEQQEKDAERTAYLNEVGITEIRFTNDLVLNNFQEVIEQINIHLRMNIPLGPDSYRDEGFPLQGARGQREGNKNNQCNKNNQ